jgi:hypothetical protein
VAGVLDRPSARLDEVLLRAGQRPRVDPRRQYEPPTQIRYDEADARGQLADVVLDFCHDPSGRRPSVRLVVETLVADDWLAAGRPGDRTRMSSIASSRCCWPPRASSAS